MSISTGPNKTNDEDSNTNNNDRNEDEKNNDRKNSNHKIITITRSSSSSYNHTNDGQNDSHRDNNLNIDDDHDHDYNFIISNNSIDDSNNKIAKNEFNNFEYWNKSLVNFNFIDDHEYDEPICDDTTKSLNNKSVDSIALVNDYYSRKSSSYLCSIDDLSVQKSSSVNSTNTTNSAYNSSNSINSAQKSTTAIGATPGTPTLNKIKSPSLITTTRFLQQQTTNTPVSNSSSPPLPSAAQSQPTVPPAQTPVIDPDKACPGSPTLSPSNKSVIPQTPVVASGSLSSSLGLASNDNESAGSVVSKLKSWIKKPAQLLNTNLNSKLQQNNTTVTPTSNNNNSNNTPISGSMIMSSPFISQHTSSRLNTDSTSSTVHHNPLSIDFVRKLKRPNVLPYQLEFSNGQVFQGSLLEEWLLQSLEEQILSNTTNYSYLNTSSSSNKNEVGINSGINGSNGSVESDEVIGLNRVCSSSSQASLPGLNNANTSATTSATSIVIDDEITITTDGTPNGNHQSDKINQIKKLNSDSYAAAMQNNSCSAFNNDFSTNSASNSNTNGLSNGHSNGATNGTSYLNATPGSNLNYKRQEANFYVQQILTNLLAIGVLEYESGFENAINKTFKVGLHSFKTKINSRDKIAKNRIQIIHS